MIAVLAMFLCCAHHVGSVRERVYAPWWPVTGNGVLTGGQHAFLLACVCGQVEIFT